MRPLRPACGTVSNAQLLALPAIIRIIAPGVVTTQLSSVPPASSSATDVAGSSDNRLATAQPPEPPPTTTKSKLSTLCRPPLSLLIQRLGLYGNSGKSADFGRFGGRRSIFWILAVTKSSKVAPRALSKAGLRWYIPAATSRPLGPRVAFSGSL